MTILRGKKGRVLAFRALQGSEERDTVNKWGLRGEKHASQLPVPKPFVQGDCRQPEKTDNKGWNRNELGGRIKRGFDLYARFQHENGWQPYRSKKGKKKKKKKITRKTTLLATYKKRIEPRGGTFNTLTFI